MQVPVSITSSLTDPGAHQFRLVSQRNAGVLSVSPVLGLQAHAATTLTKSVWAEHKNDRLER